MKKPLQHSFLGLLCLFGSNLIAQVAQSPPGQEESTPSARVGEIVIYGEIVPLKTHSELIMELWEDPIDQVTHNPAMEYFRLPLQNGTLKTGNPGSYWFRGNFPLERIAYLSIQSGETNLIQNLLVFPDDSTKFQWNERASELAFSGPSGNWMTLQQDLLRLEYSRSMERPTVIHSRNPAGMFKDQQELAEFRASQELEFGRTVEVWEIDPAGMLQDLKEIHRCKALFPKDALELIRSYAEKIPQERLDLLEVEQLAKAWKHYWVLLQSLQRYSTATPQVGEALKTFFKSSLQGFNPLETYPGRLASPAYLELNYEKVRLMQALFDTNAMECISELFEGEELDLMIAKYLFRTFPTSGLGFEVAMDISRKFKDVGLRETVQGFLAAFAPGAPISGSKFLTPSADCVGLDGFKGKTLLVHFWFTGCKASAGFYKNVLQELHDDYAEAADVQIISISVDANPKIWSHGLETGLYSNSDWKQLYVGDVGSYHPFLQTYGIYTYPHVMLIDKEGKLVQPGGFERNAGYLKARIEAVRWQGETSIIY